MDLNKLYSNHQIALMRAASANTREISDMHLGEASDYAARIRVLRAQLGASPPALGVVS